MNDSQISVRYAKALFESAKEKGVLKDVRDSMEKIFNVCALPEFQYMLVNPVMKESQKYEVFEKLFKKKTHPLSLSLVNLVIHNGREQYIPSIARFFIDLYKKNEGIKTASITSATALPDDLRDNVKSIVEKALNSSVELTTETNEALIGGFIITVDQQQYDASVANSLKEIKKQLLN